MDWSITGIIADLRHNWKGKVRRFRLHLFAFALFLTGLLEAMDPYALQAILPGRWAAVIPIAFGIGMWLLRKVTDHPVLVTTTFAGENATEPAEHPDAPTA